ncbi:MAG: accessory factor UbiK family protein [Rhodospirillales bacterium]|nr:accessory factor UbiK family protein [Rhodospirillales bacterium]
MSNQNNMFGEFTKMAEGAMSAFGGVKEEMDSFMRQHLERLLSDMDLVTREEFEVVKAMAAKARSEQEALEKKVAQLEAKLAKAPAARKPRAKTASPKAAATKAKTTKPKAAPKPKATPKAE